MVALDYRFRLTGAQAGLDDVYLPFSSFNARLKSTDPTYLQVVLPSWKDSDRLTPRINGVMSIEIVLDGVVYPFVNANLETVRTDKGPEKESITLTGHADIDYSAGNLIEIGSVIYWSILSDGRNTCRLAMPIPALTPNQTVEYGGVQFVVGEIAINASISGSAIQQTYQITEGESVNTPDWVGGQVGLDGGCFAEMQLPGTTYEFFSMSCITPLNGLFFSYDKYFVFTLGGTQSLNFVLTTSLLGVKMRVIGGHGKDGPVFADFAETISVTLNAGDYTVHVQTFTKFVPGEMGFSLAVS